MAAVVSRFCQSPRSAHTLIVFNDHPERGDTHQSLRREVGWNKTPRNAVPEYQLRGSELNDRSGEGEIAVFSKILCGLCVTYKSLTPN